MYAVIGVYLACLLLTLALKNQDVIWDARLCLKMAGNAQQHIPFNYYRHPDTQNINNDKLEFVTWWSPGQFALPMFIQQTLGLKLNIAIKILLAICLLISATGIFSLYQVALQYAFPGDDKREFVSLCLLLFTLMQPMFWESVFHYDGGGILLLAYCPWFIYTVIKIKRVNALNLFLLLIAAFAGFFLKATFTCVFMGALLYLFLSKAIDAGFPFLQQNFKKVLTKGAYLALTFAIYFMVLKLAFLSHNRNIVDSGMGIRLQPRVIAFPLIAPLFKLFALEFLNKTVYWLMGCIFVLPLYWLILKSKAIGTDYKQVLVGFFMAGTAFFMLLYILNVDVSYELRHYAFLSILLVPALFLTALSHTFTKYLLSTVIVLCTICSGCKFVSAYNGTTWFKPSAADQSGLLYSYPASLLTEINRLDRLKPSGQNIFYFKSGDPLPALQVNNNRVLLEDCFVNFGFDNAPRFQQIAYYGTNRGELYVVYPDAGFRQDSVKFLTKFQKYHQYNKIYSADGFTIYRAVADAK